MGGVFTALHTSTTGLRANQLMVDTASNNISNASDEFYSRQRVIAHPERSLKINDLFVGRGVDVHTIQRVHDAFVFDRYQKAKEDHSFSEAEYSKLKQAAELFPDVQEVGIYNDLQEYFNAWKDLSKNPSNPAQHRALIEKAISLTQNIQKTREHLVRLQAQTSDELVTNIEEVNRLAQKIATINGEIAGLESSDQKVNSLRDQRDELELHLRELIGANVSHDRLVSNSEIDKNSVELSGNYSLNIGRGYSLIDGANFHKLVIEKGQNGLARVKLQGYDFKELDITKSLKDGKIGALISLYSDSKDFKKGKLQDYIDSLDSFAKGFIEASNAVYSQGASQNLLGILNPKVDENEAIQDTGTNIRLGSFDLIAYSNDGKEIATRKVTITPTTSIKDIINQINANTDDNDDNNTSDDFDDYFSATYSEDARNNYFKIEPKESGSMVVVLRDKNTNIGGALGINPLFTGKNASEISLSADLRNENEMLKVGSTPAFGSPDIANMMQQLQYENVNFYPAGSYKKAPQNMKISDYFQSMVGKIANDTEISKSSLDTKSAILETAKNEQLAMSQVSIDEEMVNLIKFQGAYAANAKVISSIDKMIDTLLSIKQ